MKISFTKGELKALKKYMESVKFQAEYDNLVRAASEQTVKDVNSAMEKIKKACE